MPNPAPPPAAALTLRDETINALCALFPTSDEDDWLGTQSLASHLLEALSVDEPLDMRPTALPSLADFAKIAEALGLTVEAKHYGYGIAVTNGRIFIDERQWGDSRENVWYPWSPTATRALLLALLTAHAAKEASNG